MKSAVFVAAAAAALVPALVAPTVPARAGDGGAIAAGLLGGLAAGAIIGSAASAPRPPVVVRERVYVEPEPEICIAEREVWSERYRGYIIRKVRVAC